MAFKKLPPQERLLSLFHYDAETGVITNKRLRKPAGYAVCGGNSTKAHLITKVDREAYPVHRLIWMMVYGVDPGEALVDHIDRDSLNNRIGNLRLVDRSENRRNSKLNRNRVSCPYRNVYKNGKGWVARVTIQGKLRSLGTFGTPEEARDAVTKHDMLLGRRMLGERD